MKILILGDAHIGGALSYGKQSVGALNSQIIDQIKLLDWVYDRAVENNIQHIILTGDVFEEPRPNYNLVSIFIEWLQKCSEYDITIHIVSGNHDILRSGQITTSPLDIIHTVDLHNVFFYKRITTIHLDGIGITFFPFRDRRSFNTDSNAEALGLLANLLPYEVGSIGNDSLKVLVGHLALEGAIPVAQELGELANELFCPLSMFQGYDYAYFGHIHRFQVFQENPTIAHIGSMNLSDFGEAEQKKYIVIIDTKNPKPQYIELPNRKLHNIKIEITDDIIDTQQFIENKLANINSLSNSIVKLSILLPSTAAYSIDRVQAENFLYKEGVFHITKISEERQFYSIAKNTDKVIDNTISELSAIKTYAALIEDQLREDFIGLASSIVQEFKENIK